MWPLLVVSPSLDTIATLPPCPRPLQLLYDGAENTGEAVELVDNLLLGYTNALSLSLMMTMNNAKQISK